MNRQLQHLLAVAFATQLMVNDDESEADDGLQWFWMAEHNVPYDFPCIIGASLVMNEHNVIIV